MAGKKYLSDYILEERIQPGSGRIKAEAVYRGDWYRFSIEGEELKRLKITLTVLSLLCVIAFFAALSVNSPCSRFWYVILPFAGMVFPIFFLLGAGYRLLTAGNRMTREHRDKLEKRFPPVTLFLMAFSGLALIGFMVYIFSVRPTSWDWIYPVSEIVIFVSSLLIFLRRNALKMEKCSAES